MLAVVIAIASSMAIESVRASPRLAVLDVELTGDLGGPAFTSEHASRLNLASARLRDSLERADLFELVDVAAGKSTIDRLSSQHQYLHSCGECVLEIGRELGADRVLASWVYRVSNLILTLTYEMTDVATGQIVSRKSFDFRGDNDQAWTRAIEYMVRDMKSEAAK